MLKVCFALALVWGVVTAGRVDAAETATEPAAFKVVDVTLKISGMT